MDGPKLKIAVLYDTWGEEQPQADPPKKRKQNVESKVKKEKEDRDEIFDALEKLGHKPFYQVLDGTTQSLQALGKCGADLVFNLTESFNGDDTMDMNIAAYLDLLGIRYTGGGPHAQLLAQDEVIAKKMFAFHGIRTAYFAMGSRGRIG